MRRQADIPVPDELIQACVSGNCVLFAGPGLSAQVGFLTWYPFVQDLLNWAFHNRYVDQGWYEARQAAIAQGFVNDVADDLVSSLQDQDASTDLYEHIRTLFSTDLLPSGARLPEFYRTLSKVGFSSVVCYGFDSLLDKAFENVGPTYTLSDAPDLLVAVQKNQFFLLKLNGDMAREDTMLLTLAQIEDAVAENQTLARVMEALFLSRTILFVGISLKGVEDCLKAMQIRFKPTGFRRSHFALVPTVGQEWQVKASSLHRRYGLTVLPYPDPETPKHIPMQRFIKQLANQVVVGREPLIEEPPKVALPCLHRVYLENIGPFESLELQLDRRWNILLGDNGVGKSTILKAIATAVCGRDAQPYAGRLINAESASGSITLETDRNTYQTELFRSETGPTTVRLTPLALQESELMLVMGFPPFRISSWARPRSPEPMVRRLPTSEDVLPLISGDPDARMDQLKQWIVNLDHRSKAQELKTGSSGRHGQLLDDFFYVLDALSEGLTIQRGHVNPDTLEVTVITDDGELPIEAVSQGMTSLISWVGILLQRLYEIYSEDDDPKQRYALVLIDEIDAHLHPSWQQTLVRNLSNLFPNVQFIATTHSPLVIAGMPARQIFRFIRNAEGRVVQIQVEPEMSMGRADQILTSELFSLDTTLGSSTQSRLRRYQELLEKPAHTPEEQQEMERLEHELQQRVPVNGETQSDRQEQELVQAAIMRQVAEKIKNQYPKSSQTLIQKSEQILSTVENEMLP